MAKYLVQWEIDIEDAKNPTQAAEQAWAHMRRPDSTANVFTVVNTKTQKKTQVDLQGRCAAGDAHSDVIAAANGVVDEWSTSNLAPAVRILDEALQAAGERREA